MSQQKNSIQRARKRKRKFLKLIAVNETYPLATITYHGPNPDQATKIAVGILFDETRDPEVRTWTGEDIAEDVSAAREISQFIQEHQVERVLTSEWVLSCPHEPGVDFPLGEECPLCTAWHLD